MSSLVPPRMNPDLSPELARQVTHFLKWGYLVVDDALTREQVDSLRDAFEDMRTRHDTGLIHTLLEEDDRFACLLDNPPVIDRMRGILGNCIQLHSATARVTLPGEPDQDWHRDGPWPVDPDGTPIGSMPAQINCGYYLDPLTPDNGPVVVVPASHRAMFRPPAGHPAFPDELHILAKPGQAIFFSGWLYHRGAANRSDAPRRACLMCYQNAWMRSRETCDGPQMAKLRETGTPLQKMLLGGTGTW